ncbi:MAG: aspartyl protease family protein [Phaeodactylibacter sp.]|nr:aspartyl protease family protein [Phaeodactylibacter sp.]MCB9053148.1 aspartyl protease family protein [Lewinellaceae bacterium]
MKRLIPAIILLSALAIKAPAQFLDMEIQRGSRRIDIPFDYINGFIIVNITFEGVIPLRFIFDTGAEHTILSKREITDLLRVDYRRRFPIVGADLSKELYAYLVQGIELKVGNIIAKNRSILVLEEDYFRFEEYAGIDVQGILGSDFFRRFILKINYSRHTISLYDPQYWEPPGNNYVRIPIEITRNKPYLNARVQFHQDTSMQLRLLIDSGASLALLLHTDTHPGLDLPDQVIPSNLGAGLGGYIQGYMGRIEELGLESFTFREVISQFQEVSLFLDTTYSARRNGIIGNDILSRFTLIIDYVNEQAYFQPNRTYENEFEYDRSGLFLAATGPGLNHYIIYGIIPGSPAATAGILPGDEIVKINYLPANFFSLEGITRKFQKKPGTKVRMKIKRNKVRMKIILVLRDLI